MEENINNTETLKSIREQIIDYMMKSEEEKREIPEDVRIILLAAASLVDIVDNHEARLRLSERCFNSVKETYQFYDLSKWKQKYNSIKKISSYFGE